MAQLMPLPLTVSCFSKIQIGFTFLAPAHMGSPGQRAVKRVCVYYVAFIVFILFHCIVLINFPYLFLFLCSFLRLHIRVICARQK